MTFVRRRRVVLVALGAGIFAPSTGLPQTFPPPLTEEQAREVRASIAAMRLDVRGPYLRLRWFCADGTVQPPAGTPCAERGGGVQHAEFNDRAKRLAELHVHVGTILQGVRFDELFDAENDNYRLKELVLARHLFEIDDGWALRRARYYRGAKQVEDEEAKGHAFLEQLLADTAWTRRNFLLATQLVGTLPHVNVGGEQVTHRVRNLATEVAELDPAFFDIRIKIHSFPSRDDVASVERYLNAKDHSAEVRTKLSELRDALRGQYDARRNVAALERYRRRLRRLIGDEIQAVQQSFGRGDQRATLSRIAALAPALRQRVVGDNDGRTNLVLMDLLWTLEEQAFVLGQEIERDTTTRIPRNARLDRLSDYFALAHAAGFLSERERAALDGEIARIRAKPTLTAAEYEAAIGYLARSLDWATATTRTVFGPLQQRYLQFEPKAVGFVDAIVRGSTLLPQSLQLAVLGADADRVLGASHRILGREESQGVRGLNPGLAMRTLEIIDAHATNWELEPTKIYVLPETTPELKPPAGVLTLDAGNLLSHVQLLARNLGIPNATISSTLLPRLRAYHGREVFYAVSPLGTVVLEDPARLTEVERSILDSGSETTPTRVQLNTSRLRLDRSAPIPLAELRADQSGVFVGPKAANLGQLAATFPGHVSRGVAFPFGMFHRHVNRPFDSNQTVLQDLEDAYRQAAAMRTEGRSEREIDEFMFAVLARVRNAILELPWLPEVRAAVVDAVQTTFGDDVDKGVFVRSDTNVEDLPQFSGAGLNLTVPHRRTLDDILAAVKRVWTSPFSERAYLWRKQILEDQGQVYPSVLLLESIHSEKSGVLITSGLQFGDRDDLTIATAEGVGGAVEGEQAETIVVDPETGAVTLLTQTKAPFRRILVDTGSGGVRMIPAARPDYLLSERDIAQLRDIVAMWKERLQGDERTEVWDIEFGFANGSLWLFQIRPFVRFRNSAMLERLAILDRHVLGDGHRPVALEEAI